MLLIYTQLAFVQLFCQFSTVTRDVYFPTKFFCNRVGREGRLSFQWWNKSRTELEQLAKCRWQKKFTIFNATDFLKCLDCVLFIFQFCTFVIVVSKKPVAIVGQSNFFWIVVLLSVLYWQVQTNSLSTMWTKNVDANVGLTADCCISMLVDNVLVLAFGPSPAL